MLSLRKAQVQLQSHRIWLNAFTTGRSLQPRNVSRTFTWDVRLGQELKISRVSSGKGPSEAKRRKKERYERRRLDNSNEVHLGALSVRHDLMQAVRDENTKGVIRLYAELPEKRPLGEEDFRAIAQWMHQALRLENQKRERKETTVREDTDEIVAFTELLAKDIRSGNLVPSRSAHVHMLGIFKESGTADAGKQFWSWLEKQDVAHVGVETYATAIELLAVSGAPLKVLEATYRHALVRFPGDFHAYHISPHAVLPDRDQHPPIRGLPLGLLQSIMFARLLRGDSRSAYLALDTALRLFPTTASLRFFNLFLDERPVSEAYTVFAMACRAGYKMPNRVFRKLIDNLRASSDFTSVDSHTATLRAMLSTLHLYSLSTGTMVANPVAGFVITCAESFRLLGAEQLETKQRKKLVDSVLVIFRKTFEVFARYGILPPQPAFNSIIFNVAGSGRSKEVLGIVMKDLEALGMQPNDITRRCVLAVAGRWEDQEMVEKTWNDIAQAKRERGQWPDVTDFMVLNKSTRHAGNRDFAVKQLNTLQTVLPERQREGIAKKLAEEVAVLDQEISATDIEFDELLSGLQQVEADLDAIEIQTRDGPAIQDFSNQSLPMTLLEPSKLAISASDEHLRLLYEEMSTEAPQPQSSAEADSDEVSAPTSTTDITPSPPKEPILSSTNIPLGELRYQNWKSINYLLKLAEMHDQEYDQLVDEAIAAGKRPPPRGKLFSGRELKLMSEDFGVAGAEKSKQGSIEDVREEIVRLRGMADGV